MKLIKQKTLYFSEGKSDKVYEVDLCDSGSDLFIVNFRYGRRGANLREGTKTVFPVSYDEALQIFSKLITSKEKKGYSEERSNSDETSRNEVTSTKINAEREDVILKYLEQATKGTYTRDWKVSRIIRRAEILNIHKAIPLINQFINSDDEFEQYTSIHALIKFRDLSRKEDVFRVFEGAGFTTKVGRLAAAYILKFGDEVDKSNIIDSASQNLPIELRGLENKPEEFTSKLGIYLLKDKDIDAMVLYYTYLISTSIPKLRYKLLDVVNNITLRVNTFKSIRYIYRLANTIEDLKFLALVSKRIAVSKPGYTSRYLYVNNQWSLADEEKQKTNPSIAFSKKTKTYFNKDIYKFVYELSQTSKKTYISYATTLLISLDDTVDGVGEDIQYNYTYDTESRRYITEKRCFPKYHDFLAIMYIVYGNSSRMQNLNGKYFYIENSLEDATSREEILSELWNESPNEVISILAKGKSNLAISFALRILKDNPHFFEEINTSLLLRLVSHTNIEVLETALEIIKTKYASEKPQSLIIFGLLGSENEQAYILGLNWLKDFESEFFLESNFIEQLLLTANIKVIEYLGSLYNDSVKFKVSLDFKSLDPLFLSSRNFSYEYLVAVNNLIGSSYFGELFRTFSKDRIKELSNSHTTNKLFAANLAKKNEIEVYELFSDTIDTYINSNESELRRVGIELLVYFPDDFLLEHHKKISAFCFSPYNEVRAAIQPTVEKLIKLDKGFKNNLFKALLKALESVETYEGLHENCYELLTVNYREYLNTITQKEIFTLILSKYDFAQKLGAPLFDKNIDVNTLKINEIVELSHSDIYSIRQVLKTYFMENIEKINYELEHALLVFNSSWGDVVTWSCEYFEEHIKPEIWSVNMLLYACDHTKEEVQSFGRKMILKHFSDEKGLPLLLKLQEHPTKTMQFFTTNYLDNYAKNRPEVILKLEAFFKTTLFNINTNRATKTRIYNFLKQESVKSEVIAHMTVRLLKSVLDTNTIVDKSHNIDVLLSIAETYPNIEIPLLIKQS
ncbi:WGR domain-containing protein [Seonamhaeicola marinus]|uniref:WGR domain-containing protein n=1 Tax=Seonamhaeicola marinus TaxID=1912246 RepID=A0A5D0J9X8_9FLAO|nr:WGR domain-containing protein [Seonamhaeicola marinus]TYA92376.1 WGR domain-containing protein [Seonamhaeicola marinus]